jgi:hypothetical protein
MKIIKTLVFAFVATFAAISAENYPEYRIVDLGLWGTDQSEAVAINENGQVLGTYREGNYSEIFLWDMENGLKIIVPPPGISSCKPEKLNDNGQIVISAKSKGFNKIFLWDPYCGYWEVESTEKWIHVLAFNNNGQILLNIGNKLVLFERGAKCDLTDLLAKQIPGQWLLYGDASLNNHGHVAFSSQINYSNHCSRKSFLWKDGYFSVIMPEMSDNGQLFIRALDDAGNMIIYTSKSPYNGTFFIDHLNNIPIRCGNYSIIIDGFPVDLDSLPGEMRKDKGGNLYISNGFRISALIKNEFPYDKTQRLNVRDRNSKGYVVGTGETDFCASHAFLAIPHFDHD